MLYRAFASLLYLASLLLFSSAVYAEIDSTFKGQLNFDYWQLPDDYVRYLPNKEYEGAQPGLKAQWDVRAGDWSFNTKYRYSTSDSRYLDQASISYTITDNIGVRVGELPYKTSWCRTYDYGSVFIREPDPYCTYRQLAESAWSGTGMQIYGTNRFGDWVTDGQVGAYIKDQFNNPVSVGGIFLVPPNYIAKPLTSYGASFNALSITTATQVRLAWRHHKQSYDINSPGGGVDYTTSYNYDLLFAGFEFNPIDPLTIRLTSTNYLGRYTVDAKFDYLTDYNYGSSYRSSSNQITAEYQVTDNDVIGLGYGQVKTYSTFDGSILGNQTLQVPNFVAAYRHNFGPAYVAVEFMRGVSSYKPVSTPIQNTAGNAVGARFGINF